VEGGEPEDAEVVAVNGYCGEVIELAEVEDDTLIGFGEIGGEVEIF